MIIQRERFRDLIDECKPLFKLHWKEIAWKQDKIPLDVNYEVYFKMDDQDTLICFVGREAGKLIAYSAFFVMQSPHYNSTKFAINDVLFVHPDRRGSAGTKMLLYCEEELKALGVQVITYHVKDKLNFGPLLERKGYETTERNWLKWIGE